MRRLVGGIPRGLGSHRSGEGYRYGAYCRALLKRLGPLGPEAMPTLREAGLTVIDLERVRAELEAVRRKKRRQELRRLAREQGRLRLTLVSLERRLEELARQNGGGMDLAKALASLSATRGQEKGSSRGGP